MLLKALPALSQASLVLCNGHFVWVVIHSAMCYYSQSGAKHGSVMPR